MNGSSRAQGRPGGLRGCRCPEGDRRRWTTTSQLRVTDADPSIAVTPARHLAEARRRRRYEDDGCRPWVCHPQDNTCKHCGRLVLRTWRPPLAPPRLIPKSCTKSCQIAGEMSGLNFSTCPTVARGIRRDWCISPASQRTACAPAVGAEEGAESHPPLPSSTSSAPPRKQRLSASGRRVVAGSVRPARLQSTFTHESRPRRRGSALPRATTQHDGAEWLPCRKCSHNDPSPLPVCT